MSLRRVRRRKLRAIYRRRAKDWRAVRRWDRKAATSPAAANDETGPQGAGERRSRAKALRPRAAQS